MAIHMLGSVEHAQDSLHVTKQEHLKSSIKI